jgi:putative transposase
MRQIDEIYTNYPYLGAVKITEKINRTLKEKINHKRVERLMRLMSIQAIRPKVNLSKGNKAHFKYPYLLKNIVIKYPNQVWGTDITYIRAFGQWFYLVAIIDWYSRYVISWKLSPSLRSDFCIDCLKTALSIAIPEIHNSDQGVQFTSEDYIALLKEIESIKISMDGRGRCFDNIFTERLWRSLKYEEVYLKEYNSFEEANISIAKYFYDYNFERPHQALNYQMPAEVYFQKNLLEKEKVEFLKSIPQVLNKGNEDAIMMVSRNIESIISNISKVGINHT